VSKLEKALAALEHRNKAAARNKLATFIHEVEAQASKSITDEQTARLIAAASELLATLERGARSGRRD
jgi:hypothetical protein